MSKNYMNDSQASEIIKYISDTMKIPLIGAGGGFAPIGMYGWSPDYVTGAPQGWLRCEGQEVNIADYPELATFYASQHGASNYWGGDGITTFAVPDLRGEFIRGAGTNSHANQGNGGAVGEHQDGTETGTVIADGGSSGTLLVYQTTENMTVKEPDTATASTGRIKINGTHESFTDRDALFTTRPTNTSGVFFVKATVSDAEINAFNVYTPKEHQVGWWEEEIDGVWKRKPVYERTISGTSPGASGELTTGITNASKAGLVSCYIDGLHGYTLNIAYEGNTVDIKTDASTIYFNFTNSVFTSKPFRATIQYTKTTDQWQTS